MLIMQRRMSDVRVWEGEISPTVETHSGGGQDVLVLQEPIVFRDDVTIKIGGGVSFPVCGSMNNNGLCVMQRVTGSLTPGAHPGSYNGQDAYNDMFVVDDGSGSDRERTGTEYEDKREGRCAELYARSTSNYEGGGVTWKR